MVSWYKAVKIINQSIYILYEVCRINTNIGIGIDVDCENLKSYLTNIGMLTVFVLNYNIIWLCVVCVCCVMFIVSVGV